MQVDWEQKWLLIPYDESFQLLHDDFEALPPGSVVQVHAVVPDSAVSTQTIPLAEIAALLKEFQLVFAPPAGYPPLRDCEHAIPLVLPGAAPVNIRPYHYPTAIKDEIEQQVADMLARLSE
jgi:hypothetical protein